MRSESQQDSDTFGVNDGRDTAQPELRSVAGTLKWFDPVRGFGFIIPEDAEVGDILLHASVLDPLGIRSLPDGTRITCLAAERRRGWQAREVITLDTSSAAIGELPTRRGARHIDDEAISGAGELEPVRVKWFNRLKGYGFLLRESDGADVFFHVETLRTLGRDEILPDAPLLARIANGPKGIMAVSLEEPEAA